jgi:hypothetical protein
MKQYKWVMIAENELYEGWELRPRKKYGLFKFLGDILMVCLTAGFWLIWIFVREMRRR